MNTGECKKTENSELFFLQSASEHWRRVMLPELLHTTRITWKGSLSKGGARNLAKNNNIVIKKCIRTGGIKQKCNIFSVSPQVKNISLPNQAARPEELVETEVLKMRIPDAEHNSLLNRVPGYCWKSLTEEPSFSNLLSGSSRFSSSALVTFGGVINN